MDSERANETAAPRWAEAHKTQRLQPALLLCNPTAPHWQEKQRARVSAPPGFSATLLADRRRDAPSFAAKLNSIIVAPCNSASSHLSAARRPLAGPFARIQPARTGLLPGPRCKRALGLRPAAHACQGPPAHAKTTSCSAAEHLDFFQKYYSPTLANPPEPARPPWLGQETRAHQLQQAAAAAHMMALVGIGTMTATAAATTGATGTDGMTPGIIAGLAGRAALT